VRRNDAAVIETHRRQLSISASTRHLIAHEIYHYRNLWLAAVPCLPRAATTQSLLERRQHNGSVLRRQNRDDLSGLLTLRLRSNMDYAFFSRCGSLSPPRCRLLARYFPAFCNGMRRGVVALCCLASVSSYRYQTHVSHATHHLSLFSIRYATFTAHACGKTLPHIHLHGGRTSFIAARSLRL